MRSAMKQNMRSPSLGIEVSKRHEETLIYLDLRDSDDELGLILYEDQAKTIIKKLQWALDMNKPSKPKKKPVRKPVKKPVKKVRR